MDRQPHFGLVLSGSGSPRPHRSRRSRRYESMLFPFSFNFQVPDIVNPFSRAALSASPRSQKKAVVGTSNVRTAGTEPNVEELNSRARRPSPGQSLPPYQAPKSRKRGWEPSFAEPSRSTATLASSTGYLDTPAKYRDMADSQTHEFHEADSEMPPPKRRRGLAGSIVSTALSAALIGTAVGLTVYRLWRDRGKESERLPPPPPYHQGDWTPDSEPVIISHPKSQPPPSTPRSRRLKHTVSSTGKRSAHRRTRVRPQPLHRTPPRTAPPALLLPPQPEFDFDDHVEEPTAVDDQMDWIGDKLTMLIQEGKKALGREVVVMSEAKEDEVDDGSGAWEEDEPIPCSLSRSSSLKRSSCRRPRSLAQPLPSSSYAGSSYSLSPSPRKNTFDIPTAPSTLSLPIPSMLITPQRTYIRGVSVESGVGSFVPASSFKEDERCWESPELRDSMERARARYARNVRGT